MRRINYTPPGQEQYDPQNQPGYGQRPHTPGRVAKPLFPGYFSGFTGQGEGALLDPRFAVSDRGAGQTAYEGLLGEATRPYESPRGILQSSLDEYGDAQKSQTQGLVQALQAGGRGLREGDEQRLQDQRAEQGLLGQQQVRSGFEQLAGADRLQQAQTQEGLLGSLPGLSLQAQSAQQANANRLLSEIGKRSTYDQERYRATLKDAQIRDIAGAAG